MQNEWSYVDFMFIGRLSLDTPAHDEIADGEKLLGVLRGMGQGEPCEVINYTRKKIYTLAVYGFY